MHSKIQDLAVRSWIIVSCFFISLHSSQAESEWGVTYGQEVIASPGSSVILPCTFKYPEKGKLISGPVWMKDSDYSISNIVYSTKADEIVEEYRGRTSLVGDLDANNCSLKIIHAEKSDGRKYFFRFMTHDSYTGIAGIELKVQDESEWGVMYGQEVKTWPGGSAILPCSFKYIDEGKRVTWADAYSPRNTKIDFQPDRVKRGMNVIVKCVTDSWPPAHDYKWSKQMPSGDIKPLEIFGEKTELQQVQVGDAGDYQCQSTNVEGSGSATRTLLVYSVPNGVQAQQDVPALVIGQPASLSCSVANVYPRGSINISWCKDLVTEVTTVEMALPDGTFNITSRFNLMPSVNHDGKKCFCSVQGDFLQSTLEDSIVLKVKTVPDSVLAQQNVPVLMIGQPATLSCSVASVYPRDLINITWCKDVITGEDHENKTELPDGTFHVTSTFNFTPSADHYGKMCGCVVHGINLPSLLQGVIVLQFESTLEWKYIIYGTACFLALMFVLVFIILKKRNARTSTRNEEAEDNIYWDVVFQGSKT
ncbi:sialoadhesin-like isoform X2 [Petromyzon marinus]|uniref:Sialoadhesin-like isoform X2 n=1 Tax=Petromyzon marinus TaxID=7757 RepID=A0AAJ7X2L4_PETMA|nr:sialoadhesin-like isoform X2 [Petromyzon marinus]